MLGFRFLKVPPTSYVLHYERGRLRRHGRGLAFFYFAPTSVVVSVPVGSVEVPFAFQEPTADFQTVSLQGQLSFRVTQPAQLAQLMDFRIDAAGRPLSEDPDVLKQRLVLLVQTLTRTTLQRLTLKGALSAAETLVTEVTAGLKDSAVVSTLGLEIMDLVLTCVRPTPEMSRALEAQAREELQRHADEAIYTRRNAAVEQERMIRENELKTEIAVEDKKREIREKQMLADISVEQKRRELIDQKVQNDHKEAESKAFALEAMVKPLQDVDWRKLMAMNAGSSEPGTLIAMAIGDLAEHAQKIGEFNMSPELLTSLTRRTAR